MISKFSVTVNIIIENHNGQGRRHNSKQLAATKMLQHSSAMYSFSYISWLQPAAEYRGCS